MGLLRTFKDGAQYLKLWPNHAVVGGLPEAQVVPLTRLITWALPIAAVVNFAVQWTWLGSEHMASIITTSLFIALLPLQAYYWLGKRAMSELPLSLRAWYFELQGKLLQSGMDVRLPSHRKGPCYIDLAVMVRKALSVLPPEDY